MTWHIVAKKDFTDAIRSGALWVVTGVFVIFFMGSVYLFVNPPGGEVLGEDVTSDSFIKVLLFNTRLFVPAIAILVGYSAVSGERDTGQIKLLLSLPHTRRAVVLGKLVGRSCVVVVPTLIGLAAGAVAFSWTPVRLEPYNYLQFVIVTILLGLVFLWMSVAISSAVETNRRSFTYSVGVFVLLSIFWDRFATNITLIIGRIFNIPYDQALLMEVFVKLLNPITAYRSLAWRVTIVGPLEARARVLPWNLDRIQDVQHLLQEVFVSTVPWYMTDGAVVVYFLLWAVIPTVLAYRMFRTADL